ncbi:MAG: CoA-binding protein [Treponema sp.]|nr:CoA-binding protein [Treponema sp.]
MSAIVDIPEATRKRMLLLLNLLGVWPKDKITSVDISEQTGWKDSLIRHDLWLLGYNKGVSNGYQTVDLRDAINQALGLEAETKNCCIVGLGRLGAALLDEKLTQGSSFVIKAGFDSSLNRVEILRSSFPLYPANQMNWIIKQEGITLAVLTVEDKEAQTMTDRLVAAGVLGIVNMTRAVLKVPSNVRVENLSILNALKLITRG